MQNQFLEKVGKGVQLRIRQALVNPYRSVNINWFKLKYYKHVTKAQLRTHKLFGKTLYFYRPQELLHGLKEIFLEAIYKQHLTQTPYIIDCGANIGLSIIYIKQHYPNATIIAFEPDDSNFELLSKNINSFQYSNVSVFKSAVWNANTKLRFSNESSMGSRVETEGSMSAKEVSAVRLRDYITRDIDFLKIDIEGAENVVIKDIADQLHFVKNLFLEYHGTFEQNSELTEILNIITNAGFHYYIKEAAVIYETPFSRTKNPYTDYDVQLNIFCFRTGPPNL